MGTNDNSKEFTLPQRLHIENVKVHVHDNISYGYLLEPWDEHMEKLKHFHFRDDDVLLYTIARSGTHWAFRIMDMLMTGKAEIRDFHVDQVHLDLQLLEDIDRLPSPRILHSHKPFRFLPLQIKEQRTKIVHIYRNPKSVAVSNYVFLENIIALKNQASLDYSVNEMKRRWAVFMDELTNYMKENPDHPIFNASYEELSESPLATIKRLGAFLGVSHSDDVYEEIIKACSFQNLKAQEDKMNAAAGLKINYYRKGHASGWKHHLTVAQSETIDKWLKERKDYCMFSSKYIDN